MNYKLRMLLVFLPAIILCQKLNAQDGIKFRNISFDQALKASAAENKPVFLHGFASWCHFCEYMKDSVYTTKPVGDYFNSHFVNIKIDLEKEGAEMNKKLKAQSFPLLLVFDSNGRILHRLAGKKDAQDLIAFAEDAQNPSKRLYTYDSLFRAGKASPEQAYIYFNLQKRGGIDNQPFISAYFEKVPDSMFVRPEYWRILYDQYNDAERPLMSRFVKNRKQLSAVYTQDSVENRIITTYVNSLLSKAQKLDTLGYNEQVNKLQQQHDVLFDKIIVLAALNRNKMASKWDEYFKMAPRFIEIYCKTDYRRLNEVAQNYYERSNDSLQLQQAVSWAEQSVKLHDSNRNNHTLAALYLKTGNKEKAMKTAEHALEVSKPGQDTKQTRLLIDKIKESE